MKVLVIHNTYQMRGGEDTVFEAECNMLKANGISVVQLIFSNSRISGMLGKLLGFLSAFFSVSSFIQTCRLIKNEKPNLVHIHNLFFKASPSVILAAKCLGVPVVMTLHNFRLLCPSGILLHQGKIFEDSLHSYFPWIAVKKKVYRNSYIETLMLSCVTTLHKVLRTWNLVDRYILLTDFAKGKFLQSSLPVAHDKYRVKPNFCEDPGGYSSQKGDYYLFAGRLSEEKGVRIILDAFGRLGLRLVLIGHGPLEGEVRNFTHQYSNIEFHGSMDHDALLDYMKAAKALIFPSIWYETFGMVAIEAFACATSVIASKLGAMAELIRDGENGLLFEAGNASSLADAVLRFEADTDRQVAMGKMARQNYEEKYTPDVNIQLLLQIYSEIAV